MTPAGPPVLGTGPERPPIPDSPSPASGLLARLGHLALWSGLYVAGAVAFLLQFSPDVPSRDAPLPGPDPRIATVLAVALLTGIGTYLFDRVKLSDDRLDPADGASHPTRFAFLARRATTARRACAALAIAAALLSLALSPIAPLLVLASFLGVFLYAGRPRTFRHPEGRNRPKDIFLLKNAAIAASITLFAALLLSLAHHLPVRIEALPPTAALFLLVFSDSVLCDIEDRSADRRFHTDTIPALHGEPRAWLIAGLAQLAFLGVLLPTPSSSLALFWSASTSLGFVLLALLRPSGLRDIVDARLALIAAIAYLLLN